MRIANKNNVHLHFKNKNDDKSGKKEGGGKGMILIVRDGTEGNICY